MAGPRTNAQRRDKGLCGVHIGGCGEPVPPQNDVRSLDHIISEAWFKTAGEGKTAPNYNDRVCTRTATTEKVVTSTVFRRSGVTVTISKYAVATCLWLSVIRKPPNRQRDTCC